MSDIPNDLDIEDVNITDTDIVVMSVENATPHIGAWTHGDDPSNDTYYMVTDAEHIVEGASGKAVLVLTGTPTHLREFARRIDMLAVETERARSVGRNALGQRASKDLEIGKDRGIG